MKKFEVGKEYKDRIGNIVKCTRRTEKSVWFNNRRYEIKTDSQGNEITKVIIRVTDVKA